MKKIFIILLLNALIVNIYSQRHDSRPSPKERAEEIVSSIDKEIELSVESSSEIMKVMENFYLNVQQYRKEQNFSKIEKAKTERDNKIEKLLSADEYQKYLKIMEQKRPQGRKKG